jgi:hypothetical protein
MGSIIYKTRQLNYFRSVYWDVIAGEHDQDGIGLFGTLSSAQEFADNLNRGKPVSSIYDRLRGDDEIVAK